MTKTKAWSPWYSTAASGTAMAWRTPSSTDTCISMPGFSLPSALGNSARALIERVRVSTRVSSLAMRPATT